MASISSKAKMEKPSFAKIAAAGMKRSGSQPSPHVTDKPQKNDVTLTPGGGTSPNPPSVGSAQPGFSPSQTSISPSVQNNQHDTKQVASGGPHVRIHNAGPAVPLQPEHPPLEDRLMPTASEEASTQFSSSSDPVKPPSLDGKSVTSGTTFALDEKESLRPDDSASVMAHEDDELFSPPSAGLPDSRAGSDDGVRAFREQLREISGMEPSRRPGPPPNVTQNGLSAQGVLYIPPQGLGVGAVPSSSGVMPVIGTSTVVPPDSKLLEAMESPKDRIMVLKLEQDIVDFVKDPKESSLKLPQTNAFYRMLAHRLADYYLLGHGMDESNQAVRIFKTPGCRLPPPLTDIATPSTAASTPPPLGTQMKILRRGENVGPTIANGSNLTSKTTSEAGESGAEDDKRSRAPVTREEREARYEAARKRIMGSAKPSESPEEMSNVVNSRSSSANGRRSNKKKQRPDSDDDFEARSAYSAYYPPPFSPNTSSNPALGVPGYGHVGNNPMNQPHFANQPSGEFQQFSSQSQGAWSGPAYPPSTNVVNWPQSQPQGYELAVDFQRAMSFQSPPPNAPLNFNTNFPPSYFGQQQMWPPQNFSTPTQPASSPYGYPPSGFNRPSSSSGQAMENQPYAFGQLPSQTFPGRPASKMEHPLPGSYKSKHFNPQSQTFVPGQAGADGGATTGMDLPQLAGRGSHINSPAYAGGYPGHTSLASSQPQHPTSLNNSASYTPAQSIQPTATPRTPAAQPMTHPLPQPVFPRQPSPNVPLPPRPETSADSLASAEMQHQRSSATSPSSGVPSSLPSHSTIAKWGTPASLPPKPPPAAEPFDPSRLSHAHLPQRQTPSSSPYGGGGGTGAALPVTPAPSAAAVARKVNGFPSFGSMPPPTQTVGASSVTQALPTPRRS